MAYSTPFVNAAGAPYQGPPIPLTGPQFATSNGSVQMDPRILTIVQNAAQAFTAATGQPVELFSGVQDRSTGTVNHPTGNAIDVQIYDSKGQPIPNGPAQAKADGVPLAASFRTYETFAQTARDIQQRNYPELNDTFRWGGYFASGVNPLDLMHLDITPNSKLGLPASAGENQRMGGGTWEGGLNADGSAAFGRYGGGSPGSVGMNDVILHQLSDLGYSGPNAVTNYQRDHGLTPDGIIGPQTAGRIALAVTPPANVPNPFGMHDVAQAIFAGDPQALQSALTGTMSQVMSAINGGTSPDQIGKDLQGYFKLLSPPEQVQLRANFQAGQDLQNVLKSGQYLGSVPPIMRGLAQDQMTQAVAQAMQQSQDLSASMMAGKPVGSTTEADLARAYKQTADYTTKYVTTTDKPRIRPTNLVGPALSAVASAVPAAPTGVPAGAAAGMPAGLHVNLRPGDNAAPAASGAASAPRLSMASLGPLGQAMMSLLPGLPGIRPGTTGPQAAPQAAAPADNAPPRVTPAGVTGLSPNAATAANAALGDLGAQAWTPGAASSIVAAAQGASGNEAASPNSSGFTPESDYATAAGITPPQTFTPESDYSAAQQSFVPESDYATARGITPSQSFIPESDYAAAQQKSVPESDTASAQALFKQFTTPTASAQPRITPAPPPAQVAQSAPPRVTVGTQTSVPYTDTNPPDFGWANAPSQDNAADQGHGYSVFG